MALRFSIIVPTLDRKEMLFSAIASLRAQSWPDVQIIVVDGGSTDGTLESISALPDISLLKGPDRGVYDAFNKGIAQATGDVIGLLNSDDSYEPGSFAAVAQAFARNADAQAVCGSATLVEDGRTIATFDDSADKLLSSPRTALIGSCIPNARFFRRSAMAAVGRFSLDYRYVADRDWLTRWYEAGLKTVAIANPVYRYRQHATSLTFDPGGRLRTAIYAELLALAQSWRQNRSARRATHRVAGLLEGRCRGRLALDALRHGRFGAAARFLGSHAGQVSAMPIALIALAGIDRLIGAPLRSGPDARPSS